MILQTVWWVTPFIHCYSLSLSGWVTSFTVCHFPSHLSLSFTGYQLPSLLSLSSLLFTSWNFLHQFRFWYATCSPLGHLLAGSGQTGLTVLTSVYHFHPLLFNSSFPHFFHLPSLPSLSFTCVTVTVTFLFGSLFVTSQPTLVRRELTVKFALSARQSFSKASHYDVGSVSFMTCIPTSQFFH